MKNVNLNSSEWSRILTSVSKVPVDQSKRADVTLIKLPDLKVQSRLLLRKTLNADSSSRLVLVSEDSQVSKLAWRIQAFHFLDTPLSEAQLRTLCQKMGGYRLISKRLKLTFKGGFRMVNTSNISVINGKGCYCKFYFSNDRPALYTLRISDLENRLWEIPELIRLNRSLIVNLNNLLRIEGNTAWFKGDKVVKLILGKRTITRLKKELIWL